VTVLLTTHYLEEAEELCDRIAIINHGKVIACEPKSKLLGRIDAKELLLTLTRDLTAIPESLAPFKPELTGARLLKLHYRPNQTPFAQILNAVEEAGLEIADLSTVETDLEDIFLQLTRRGVGSPA
jgi:ABC-2 type transport system ATP-binding protein